MITNCPTCDNVLDKSIEGDYIYLTCNGDIFDYWKTSICLYMNETKWYHLSLRMNNKLYLISVMPTPNDWTFNDHSYLTSLSEYTENSKIDDIIFVNNYAPPLPETIIETKKLFNKLYNLRAFI